VFQRLHSQRQDAVDFPETDRFIVVEVHQPMRVVRVGWQWLISPDDIAQECSDEKKEQGEARYGESQREERLSSPNN